MTHSKKGVSPFIGKIILLFFRVGLMGFTLFVGDVADRGATDHVCEMTRIGLMDLGSPDPKL